MTDTMSICLFEDATAEFNPCPPQDQKLPGFIVSASHEADRRIGPCKEYQNQTQILSIMMFLLVLPLCFETKAHYEAQSGLKFTTV